jgi:molecular chaperone DnaK
VSDDVRERIRTALDELTAAIEEATVPSDLQPKVEALAEASQELGKAVYADASDEAEAGSDEPQAHADEDVEDVEVIEEDEPAAKV